MRGWLEIAVFLACAICTLGLACEIPPIFVYPCADPALTIQLIDADSNEPVVNATVVASNGVAMETLQLHSDVGPYCGRPYADYWGIGQAGSYTVQIEAEGYVGQMIEVIVVPEEANGCGYVPVDLLVKLRALP